MQRLEQKNVQEKEKQSQKIDLIKKELQKYRELKKSPSFTNRLSSKQLLNCNEIEKRKKIFTFINNNQIEHDSLNFSNINFPQSSRNYNEKQNNPEKQEIAVSNTPNSNRQSNTNKQQFNYFPFAQRRKSSKENNQEQFDEEEKQYQQNISNDQIKQNLSIDHAKQISKNMKIPSEQINMKFNNSGQSQINNSDENNYEYTYTNIKKGNYIESAECQNKQEIYNTIKGYQNNQHISRNNSKENSFSHQEYLKESNQMNQECFREITLADVHNFYTDNIQNQFNLQQLDQYDYSNNNKLNSQLNSNHPIIKDIQLKPKGYEQDNYQKQYEIMNQNNQQEQEKQDTVEDQNEDKLTFEDLRVKHSGMFQFKEQIENQLNKDVQVKKGKRDLSLQNIEQCQNQQSSWVSTLISSGRNDNNNERQMMLHLQSQCLSNHNKSQQQQQQQQNNYMTSNNTLNSQMSQNLKTIGSGRLNQSINQDQQIQQQNLIFKDYISTTTNSKQTILSKGKTLSKDSEGFSEDIAHPRNLNIQPHHQDKITSIKTQIQTRLPFEEKEGIKNNNSQSRLNNEGNIENVGINKSSTKMINKPTLKQYFLNKSPQKQNSNFMSPSSTPKNFFNKQNKTFSSDIKKMPLSSQISPNSKKQGVQNINKENKQRNSSDKQDRLNDSQNSFLQYKNNSIGNYIQQKASTAKYSSQNNQKIQPYFKSVKTTNNNQQINNHNINSDTNSSSLQKQNHKDMNQKLVIDQEKQKEQHQNQIHKKQQNIIEQQKQQHQKQQKSVSPTNKALQEQQIVSPPKYKQTQKQDNNSKNNNQKNNSNNNQSERCNEQQKQQILEKQLNEEQERWKQFGSQMVLAYEELNQNFQMLVQQKKQQDVMLQQLVESLTSKDQDILVNNPNNHYDRYESGESRKQFIDNSQRSSITNNPELQQAITDIESRLYKKFDKDDSDIIQKLLNQLKNENKQNQLYKQKQDDIQNIVHKQIKESSSLADQIIHLRTQLDKACITIMKNQKQSNTQFSSMFQLLSNSNQYNNNCQSNPQHYYNQQENLFNPNTVSSSSIKQDQLQFISSTYSPIPSQSNLNQPYINLNHSSAPHFSEKFNNTNSQQNLENILSKDNDKQQNNYILNKQNSPQNKNFPQYLNFGEQTTSVVQFENKSYIPFLNNNHINEQFNDPFDIVSPIKNDRVPFFGEMMNDSDSQDDDEEIHFQAQNNSRS